MSASYERHGARRGRPLLVLWAAGAGLAFAFGALAVVVSSRGVLTADLEVAVWIQNRDPLGWEAFLNTGEWFTNVRGGLLICLISVLGFWLRNLPAAAVTIVVAPAIWVAKHFIEEFIARPRPTVDLVDVTQFGDGFSFPSGHITAGLAVYGMLAIIAVLSFERRSARVATVSLAAAVLVSSAFSRVAFGAHWPTDVLGGLLLGALWLVGLTWFYVRLEQSGLADYLLPARLKSMVRAG
jgi:undecaprenyl-diphosphatase